MIFDSCAGYVKKGLWVGILESLRSFLRHLVLLIISSDFGMLIINDRV